MDVRGSHCRKIWWIFPWQVLNIVLACRINIIFLNIQIRIVIFQIEQIIIHNPDLHHCWQDFFFSTVFFIIFKDGLLLVFYLNHGFGSRTWFWKLRIRIVIFILIILNTDEDEWLDEGNAVRGSEMTHRKGGLKGFIYLGLRTLRQRRINHQLLKKNEKCQQQKNCSKDKIMRKEGKELWKKWKKRQWDRRERNRIDRESCSI